MARTNAAAALPRPMQVHDSMDELRSLASTAAPADLFPPLEVRPGRGWQLHAGRCTLRWFWGGKGVVSTLG
jgi:hypothetical protein